jgi:hypothetical protein
VSGHQDRRLRLWDPAAPETAMQGQVLGAKAKGGGAHAGWVSGVAWSPTSEFHLASVRSPPCHTPSSPLPCPLSSAVPGRSPPALAIITDHVQPAWGTQCSLEGELKLWDTRASVPLHTMAAHPEQVSRPPAPRPRFLHACDDERTVICD